MRANALVGSPANVKALFQEYAARSVDCPQRLVRQAWGGLDFHVRDPDGNVISFVQNRGPAPHAEDRREQPYLDDK